MRLPLRIKQRAHAHLRHPRNRLVRHLADRIQRARFGLHRAPGHAATDDVADDHVVPGCRCADDVLGVQDRPALVGMVVAHGAICFVGVLPALALCHSGLYSRLVADTGLVVVDALRRIACAGLSRPVARRRLWAVVRHTHHAGFCGDRHDGLGAGRGIGLARFSGAARA